MLFILRPERGFQFLPSFWCRRINSQAITIGGEHKRKEDIEIYGNYFLQDGIGYRRITVLSLDGNPISYARGHFNKSFSDGLLNKNNPQSVRSLTAVCRKQTPQVQGLATPLRIGRCGVNEVFESMIEEGDSIPDILDAVGAERIIRKKLIRQPKRRKTV